MSRKKRLGKCGHLSVCSRKHRLERHQIFIIHSKINHCIYDDHSRLTLHDLIDIAAAGVHRDSDKVVLVGIKSYSIYSRNPKSVAGVAIDTLNLIVRNSKGITGAEMLMELMDIESVQTTESTYPYMAVDILSKGSYSLVGNSVCDDRCFCQNAMRRMIHMRTSYCQARHHCHRKDMFSHSWD